MATRLNKTKLAVKSQATPMPGPLRAKHSIARPAQVDKSRVEEVISLSRQLRLFEGRHIRDAKIVDTLLTPSPQRFEILCKSFQSLSPEIEEELEELKPAPKMTLEETRFHHVMEFCHDAGIFDDGDDLDLLKIKGELTDGEHINFWLTVLRTAKLMVIPTSPAPSVQELISTAEEMSQVSRIFEKMDPSLECASLISGELLEKIEDTAPDTLTAVELRKLTMQFDSQLHQLQNQIAEIEEDDANDSVDQEEPPETMLEDTSLTKMKLLQGNLKDLVNTFLAMYDSSLKNAVASRKSVPVVPSSDLQKALLSASQHQASLQHFIDDIRRILERMSPLRAAISELPAVASQLASENSNHFTLNMRNCPPLKSEFLALRAVHEGRLIDV